MTKEQVSEVEKSFQVVSGAIRRIVEIEAALVQLNNMDKKEEMFKERHVQLLTEHSQCAGVVRSVLLGFHTALWYLEGIAHKEPYFAYSEDMARQLDEYQRDKNHERATKPA